jgi:hypothetical protein
LRRYVSASALTRSLGVHVSRIGRITSSGKAVLVNAPDSIGRGGAPLLAGWDQLRSRPSG